MSAPPDAARQRATDLTGAQLAALKGRLATHRSETAGIERQPDAESHPLSYPQRRVWFIECLHAGTPLYNVARAIRLRGPLDVERLRAGIGELVARHEALRTTYANVDDEPRQFVRSPFVLDVPVFDVDANVLDARLAEFGREPFDLAHGPVLRAGVFRLDAAHHILCLVIHHLACDGWSLKLLFDELARSYRGDAPLPVANVRYRDFAYWQTSTRQQRRIEADVRWWRQSLQGAPTLLELPFASRTRVVQSGNGAFTPVGLDPARLERLTALAEEEGATRFMALLAAFSIALHRFTGLDDFLVGTASAGRDRPETQATVGFFVDTVVLRADLSGQPSAREVLRRTRQQMLDAMAHASAPFERVVEALGVPRDPGHHPLFQVQFNAPPQYALVFEGLEASPVDVDLGISRFDLEFTLSLGANRRTGFTWNADVYDEADMTRFGAHLAALVRAMVDAPDVAVASLALDDNPAANVHRMPARSQRYAHPLDAFEARARAQPDATAVRAGADAADSLDYATLDARATRLGQRLAEHGAGAGTRIGIALPRGLDLAVALLATWKCGAAYVPLDPNYPARYLDAVAADAELNLVITDATSDDRLAAFTCIAPDGEADPAPTAVERDPADLAYVLFTSGSSGRPKGVMVETRALACFLHATQALLELAPGDRLVSVTSIGFDIFALEFFAPLLAGAEVVVAPRETAVDGAALGGLLDAVRATHLQATPATWQLLEAVDWHPQAPLVGLCGGELLPADLAQYVAGTTTHAFNLYGPTEATVWASALAIDADAYTPGQIGSPLDGYAMAVLDALGRALPEGVAGELAIGGEAVARGYAGNDALTDERFVDVIHLGRAYLTGDRALWRRDASNAPEFVFLGRLDSQLKVRGFRIEPSAVEAALRACDGVSEAAVERVDTAAGEALAAFVVARDAPSTTRAALRAKVGSNLPAYMVPDLFVRLDALPRLPNGKLDRAALADAVTHDDEHGDALQAPRTPQESELVALWSEVLGHSRIGVTDAFFDVGGHSLLALRLVARMAAAGYPTTLLALFEGATIASIAATATAAHEDERPRIEAQPDADSHPLSYPQRRVWFIECLHPGTPLYNVARAMRFDGTLDVDRLRSAVRALVHRHEVLRTTYTNDANDEPRQRVQPTFELDVPLVDVGAGEAALDSALTRLARDVFDLECGPVLRSALFRIDATRHVLALVIHHLACDGTSFGLLFDDLARNYTHGTRSTQPLVRYRDYAHWQGQPAHAERIERDIAWWKEQLRGAPTLLELPAARRSTRIQSGDGGFTPFEAEPAHLDALEELAGEEHATRFIGLLAVFCILLHRYTGRDDFVVGTSSAGRSVAPTEDMVGFFVDTVVIRADFTGEPTARETIRRVRDAVLAAMAHADAPFERVVEALSLPRDLSHHPLFQVHFDAPPQPALDVEGFDVTPVSVDTRVSRFDLEFSLSSHPKRRSGLRWNADVYNEEVIERLLGHYALLVEAVAAEPDIRVAALPLSAAPRANVLRTPAPSDALRHPLDVFEARVRARPGATALRAGRDANDRLDYATLDARANRLANHLVALGVGPGARIGIAVPRSLELGVALLATLKCGAAYVPLDPDYPARYREHVTEDADLSLVIANSDTHERFAGLACVAPDAGADAPALAPSVARDLDALAYVLFTSGSSGRPKGVMIDVRALATFLGGAQALLDFEAHHRLVSVTPIGFDIFALEFFAPLLAGAEVTLAPREVAIDGVALGRLLTDVRGTHMQATPATWQLLEASGWRPATALTGLCGGELLAEDLARYIAGITTRAFNLYGPTEATVWATALEIDPAFYTAGQIGAPLAGYTALVLDAVGRPLPAGVAGELALGGDAVARGYVGREDLTRERFVAVDGVGHAYLTGDRALWTLDVRGAPTVTFLGRMDGQLKVRGYRIEPSAVEAVLRAHAGVDAAAVERVDTASGEALAAFVVARETMPTRAELRQHVSAFLPMYMVPDLVVPLAALPRLPNGKLDRSALDAASTSDLFDERVAPRSAREAELTALWSQVLGHERVGVSDAFFDIGGHSLLALRLVARMDDAGFPVTLLELFEGKTIEAIAAANERGVGVIAHSPVSAIRATGSKAPFLAVGSHPQYRRVAAHIDPQRPVYRLDVYSLKAQRRMQHLSPLLSIEAMAAKLVDELRTVQPAGPYWIGGGCEGALVAFETARQLALSGEDVASLVLWITPTPAFLRDVGRARSAPARVLGQVKSLVLGGAATTLSIRAWREAARHELIEYQIFRAMDRYQPSWIYPGRLHVVRTQEHRYPPGHDATLGWREHARDGVEVHYVPGNHDTWLAGSPDAFGAVLDASLDGRPTAA